MTRLRQYQLAALAPNVLSASMLLRWFEGEVRWNFEFVGTELQDRLNHNHLSMLRSFVRLSLFEHCISEDDLP